VELLHEGPRVAANACHDIGVFQQLVGRRRKESPEQGRLAGSARSGDDQRGELASGSLKLFAEQARDKTPVRNLNHRIRFLKPPSLE
jgi:hypothetical protein